MDALSQLTINGNQETTQESDYIIKIISEINDIYELTEDIFFINLKRIDQYQRKEPSLMEIYITGK